MDSGDICAVVTCFLITSAVPRRSDSCSVGERSGYRNQPLLVKVRASWSVWSSKKSVTEAMECCQFKTAPKDNLTASKKCRKDLGLEIHFGRRKYRRPKSFYCKPPSLRSQCDTESPLPRTCIRAYGPVV